jgi:uncharacterized protein
MSLYESLDSSGTISLRGLFDSKSLAKGQESPLNSHHIAYCLCRGGWPENIDMDVRIAQERIKSYVNFFAESDEAKIGNYSKNPEAIKRILLSYSRNISTIAEMEKTILSDVVSGDVKIGRTEFYE